MQVVACARPTDATEPAPLTDLPLHMAEGSAHLSAFWGGDDSYYVRAESLAGTEDWYRIEAEQTPDSAPSAEALLALGALMADVLPLGIGRVAFPAGSGGRTVYRVWRSQRNERQGKTRILAVRAVRSRRRPA